MPEKKSGCGILNAVFGRRSFWLRRTTSTGSIPNANPNGKLVRTPSTPNSKRRRGGGSSDETAFLEAQPKHMTVTSMAPQRTTLTNHQNQAKKPPLDGSMVPSYAVGLAKDSSTQSYIYQGRKVPREAIGISGELDMMISDHQKTQGGTKLIKNLGNLRQQDGGGGGGGGGGRFSSSYNAFDKEDSFNRNPKLTGNDQGYIAKKRNEKKPGREQPESLCRALSTRMDPETLKIMGNEDFKNGRFAEALALYEAAISIDPNKASYRSNKSAALTALGRLLEAVFECREAIRIEPHYHRAHHRLATLYLRLGDAEKAIYHYKHSGPEADSDDLIKAKTLQGHLNKCTEARRLRDWNALVKNTGDVVLAGADSAPQIYALQAEAFMKLHRHEEANEAMLKTPSFDVDACTQFFGPISNANLLTVRAMVHMAIGRFDDALEAAQRAARLDSSNKEVNMIMRNVQAIGKARLKGNELFKRSNFSAACVAYEEGLEIDPYNSVLLCNRAACRSKLGQFEKGIQDCSAALAVHPSYNKARLRRADIYGKMKNWKASVDDYEILAKEMPGEEEVEKALSEAKTHLKKQRGEDE